MKKLLLSFSLLFIGYAVSAQNYFYNSQQFGLASMLLGGAVSAGNNDLSMAYYNPGALHLAQPKANISLIQPRYEVFGLGDFFGKEAKSSNFDLSLSPSLVSYRINLNERVKLVVITIQKSQWDHDAKSSEISQTFGGNRESIFKYRYQGSDRWIGAGWSYQISDLLSIGFSQFFSLANFTYGYTMSQGHYDAVTQERVDFFSENVESYVSNSFSSVTKFGLHAQHKAHSFGLVVKTPNYLPISKNGEYERHIIDVSSNQNTQINLSNFGLNPLVRTPWEINVGYAFAFRDASKLWLNVDYHTKVAEYRMARIAQIDGSEAEWVNGNKQVTNFSIGYSERVSPKIELIGSFRTNFFAYENRAPVQGKERLFVLDDDRYHVTLGTNVNIKESRVLLGVDWGYAGMNSSELFSGFPNLNRFVTNESEFKNHTLTLLFTYGFLLDRIKRER